MSDPKTCCNQDCNQGRDCPQRSRKVKAYPEVPAVTEPFHYVATWRDYLPDLARAMLIVTAVCVGSLVASMLVIARCA